MRSNGRKYEIGVLIIVSVFAVVIMVKTKPLHGGGKSNVQAEQREGYLIYMDETSERNLLDKAKKIERGATVEQVKAILGPSFEDQLMIGKKGEFRARLVVYYIRKKSHLVNEINDRYVYFYFNQSDRLTDVTYKLSEKLEESGWPVKR
jgi:hypothetical protein